MKDQKEYWENRILDWEDISYGTAEAKPVSLVERAGHYFRGPVRHRPLVAMQIVQKAKPARILELGCGSGRLAFDLVTRAGVSHVTGVDISEHAVNFANERARALGMSDKLTFLASSIADLDFNAQKPYDFVLGMGLTPYLNEMEFARLFEAMRGATFLFDVHPKGVSLQNFSHAVYRMIKGHPFYNRFSRDEILGRLTKAGFSNVTWNVSQGVFYVTNVG
jgi:cyclopropane fatty-acyl-phospholipid synthase-like methyltransferase